MTNSGSLLGVREINCPLTIERQPQAELTLSCPCCISMRSVPITETPFKMAFLTLYFINCCLESQLNIDSFWTVSSNLITNHLKYLIFTLLCSDRFFWSGEVWVCSNLRPKKSRIPGLNNFIVTVILKMYRFIKCCMAALCYRHPWMCSRFSQNCELFEVCESPANRTMPSTQQMLN